MPTEEPIYNICKFYSMITAIYGTQKPSTYHLQEAWPRKEVTSNPMNVA